MENYIQEICESKEIEMAKQAKDTDTVIFIFDGANYSSWKFRLMTYLEYKQCKEQEERKLARTDIDDDWYKKDLKERHIYQHYFRQVIRICM